jgi:hypothetical protein
MDAIIMLNILWLLGATYELPASPALNPAPTSAPEASASTADECTNEELLVAIEENERQKKILLEKIASLKEVKELRSGLQMQFGNDCVTEHEKGLKRRIHKLEMENIFMIW